MSHVRMCDRCGTIFSELAEDWTTFSGSQRRRDPATGKYYTNDVMQDSCPKCSRKAFGQVAPKAALEGSTDDLVNAVAEKILHGDVDDT